MLARSKNVSDLSATRIFSIELAKISDAQWIPLTEYYIYTRSTHALATELASIPKDRARNLAPYLERCLRQLAVMDLHSSKALQLSTRVVQLSPLLSISICLLSLLEPSSRPYLALLHPSSAA